MVERKVGEDRDFILLTRPRDRAEFLAQDLARKSFSTLIEPMFEIVPQTFSVPDLQHYQGLVFTSATAVEIFAAAHAERSLPVYCVGRQTQDAAHAQGYKKVYCARGAAADLVAYIKDNVVDKAQPLLHVRAAQVAYPLQEDLQAAGYTLGRVIVYDTDPALVLSTNCVLALAQGRIQAAIFFSRRTAENFLKLIEAAGLTENLSGIKALCLSETVLQYVRPELWRDVCVAAQPDREGMAALIAQHCDAGPGDLEMKENVEHVGMSKSENKPIENAAEVIERFGGIRPMAKKIDVAVTTVQGWKKRDVIPAARRQAILEAAVDHNVDLSDILPDAPPANENQPAPAEEASAAADVPESPEVEAVSAPVSERPSADEDQPEAMQMRLDKAEKHALSRHSWLVIVVILGLVIGVVALLWPQKTGNQGEPDRLSALEERTRQIEGEVADVKDQQGFLGALIPENLDEQLAGLQEQAGQAKETLGQAVEKAQEVSADVLAEDAGTLSERAQKLETHLQEMTGSPVLAGALEKWQAMQGAPEGQTQIDRAMEEMSAIMGGLEGQLGAGSGLFESTLDSARGQSDALGQTFESVPATDLKAAALLLAMTQFRSSLNRDNAAFENDLDVLMGLVGEDNTELRSALTKLAPHAQEGVLTPSGLSDEFKTLAGDAVMASLQGEDVSLGERAKARMNEVLQVEKDGELISGTQAQVKLAAAEKMLEDGNLEEAVMIVETMEGDAGLHMSEWLDKANVTLMAQKLKGMLTQSVNSRAYGGGGGLTAGGGVSIPGTSKLIQNEETGINILKRNSLPNADDLPNPFQ